MKTRVHSACFVVRKGKQSTDRVVSVSVDFRVCCLVFCQKAVVTLAHHRPSLEVKDIQPNRFLSLWSWTCSLYVVLVVYRSDDILACAAKS